MKMVSNSSMFLFLNHLHHFLPVVNISVPADPQKLIELKRLTSESLKLQGVPFDQEIQNIQFDGTSWGETVLSVSHVAIMTEIVNWETRTLLKNRNAKNIQFSFKIPVNDKLKTVKSEQDGEIEENVFSVSEIKEDSKKQVIRSVFDQLNSESICRYSFVEGNSSRGLLIAFKEESKLDPFLCGRAPLGSFSNKAVIEITRFDVRTVSRLIMSVLGFVSPIWSPDRDKYVQINWRNVDDKYKYLFHKWNFEFIKTRRLHNEKSIARKAYDFTSALHFTPIQFSKTGRDVIWQSKLPVLLPNRIIGFSDKDFEMIQHVCIRKTPAVPRVFNCVDKDVQCLFYKQQQVQCSADLQQQCPVICDFCTPDMQASCTDANEFCLDWKASCNAGPHVNYMKSNCRNTCGCPSVIEPDVDLWITVDDTKEICDTHRQRTIKSTEAECKVFCKENQLAFCFWDVSFNDGDCFGTTSCRVPKTIQTVYRKFERK